MIIVSLHKAGTHMLLFKTENTEVNVDHPFIAVVSSKFSSVDIDEASGENGL